MFQHIPQLSGYDPFQLKAVCLNVDIPTWPRQTGDMGPHMWTVMYICQMFMFYMLTSQPQQATTLLQGSNLIQHHCKWIDEVVEQLCWTRHQHRKPNVLQLLETHRNIQNTFLNITMCELQTSRQNRRESKQNINRKHDANTTKEGNCETGNSMTTMDSDVFRGHTWTR